MEPRASGARARTLLPFGDRPLGHDRRRLGRGDALAADRGSEGAATRMGATSHTSHSVFCSFLWRASLRRVLSPDRLERPIEPSLIRPDLLIAVELLLCLFCFIVLRKLLMLRPEAGWSFGRHECEHVKNCCYRNGYRTR